MSFKSTPATPLFRKTSGEKPRVSGLKPSPGRTGDKQNATGGARTPTRRRKG